MCYKTTSARYDRYQRKWHFYDVFMSGLLCWIEERIAMMNYKTFSIALLTTLLATTCTYAASVQNSDSQSNNAQNNAVLTLDAPAASTNAAGSKSKESKTTPIHMSCEDFLALDTQAQTPVVFWVSNLDTHYKGGDYVDEQQVDEFVTPMVIEECNKAPATKLVDLKSKIEQYVKKHF